MKCGICGFASSLTTPERRVADVFEHIKSHPPRVITDLREIFPADAFDDDTDPGGVS